MSSRACACIVPITLESPASQQCSRHTSGAFGHEFPHAALTTTEVAWLCSHCARDQRRGPRFVSHLTGALRADSLADPGRRSARRREMTVAYALSALLTVALFVYLLYALLRPEKF